MRHEWTPSRWLKGAAAGIAVLGASLCALDGGEARAQTTTTLPANILFMSDWSRLPATGSANNWRYRQVWTNDRIRYLTDSTSPKRGVVGRIEVRPGDKVGGFSGERAEYLAMQDSRGQPLPVTTQSGHEYYGIAIKVPTTWQSPQRSSSGTWGIFFQLHGPDTLRASPAIALIAENDYRIQLDAGDLLDGGTRSSNRPPVKYSFTNGALNKGQWVQFMLDVVWSPTNTGYVAVYRRDQGQTTWTRVFERRGTPTLQWRYRESVGPHYWKAGFYRSPSSITNVLYLGPVVRGRTFADVAMAAFGQR